MNDSTLDIAIEYGQSDPAQFITALQLSKARKCQILQLLKR